MRLLTFCVVTQQTAAFWGVGTHDHEPMTPKFELRREFCTMYLIAKFHHPTFNRSEDIVLTNNRQTDKQTPLKTSISLRYATPMGNNVITDLIQ